MKPEDKIILYLDGQLEGKEKEAFEKELGKSQQLRDELDKLKDFYTGLNGIKNIQADEDYFIQMTPKFRAKEVRRRRFGLFPGIAYTFTTATAVIVIMLFVTNRSGKNEAVVLQNIQPVQQSATTELVHEAGLLAEQFDFVNISHEDAANYDTLLNSMLVRELNLTSQSIGEISQSDNSANDIQTIMQGVNDKEADAIYKELLHKKIL